jgi:hypothetical protein
VAAGQALPEAGFYCYYYYMKTTCCLSKFPIFPIPVRN